MRVLMINVVCGIRSTGRICTDLALELEKQGHEVKIAYGREEVPEKFRRFAIRIGNDFDVHLHGAYARLMDACGFGSKSATKRFLEWVDSYNPDIVHLHNIHGYYINIEELFSYLKYKEKKVIWTMHDCWAITGHCSHFEYVSCKKWKTGCKDCVQKKEYPKSLFFDKSSWNYEKKKQLFSGLDYFEIVTPSQWLASIIKESFLGEYPVHVINNGIDISVFKPIEGNLRQEYGLEKKKIILGVATAWGIKKGFDVFGLLSEELDDNYQIILVGLTKEQISKLPRKIIGIERTQNIEELAQFYTLADVFVNPTLEDTYPTTNLESIACGTPVITYKTGGSPESAVLYGDVIEKGNIERLIQSVKTIETITKNFVSTDSFDLKVMVDRYLSLYIDLLTMKKLNK